MDSRITGHMLVDLQTMVVLGISDGLLAVPHTIRVHTSPATKSSYWQYQRYLIPAILYEQRFDGPNMGELNET